MANRAESDIFGDGRFALDKIDLASASKEQMTWHFGTHLGCPSIEKLMEERGAEQLAGRYAQLLLYHQWVVRALNSNHRHDIAASLSKRRPRLSNQPLNGKLVRNVPSWNIDKIPGTETAVGYAMPRIISDALWKTTYFSPDIASRISLVDETLKVSINSLKPHQGEYDLLAIFAENVALSSRTDPKLILKAMLSAGKRRQDSMYVEFVLILDAINDHTSVIKDAYHNMPNEEKTKLGIAIVTGR